MTRSTAIDYTGFQRHPKSCKPDRPSVTSQANARRGQLLTPHQPRPRRHHRWRCRLDARGGEATLVSELSCPASRCDHSGWAGRRGRSDWFVDLNARLFRVYRGACRLCPSRVGHDDHCAAHRGGGSSLACRDVGDPSLGFVGQRDRCMTAPRIAYTCGRRWHIRFH
jgi:hypothetical protein